MSDVVTALHSSVDRLHGIVVGLDADQLRQQAYPTEWTVADVLSHLGSGAVISRRGLEDGLAGVAPDPAFNQTVWDEWNAKDPEAQAAGVLEADAALIAGIEAASAEQRAAFRFTMGPFDLGFDGFVGLRLNEHALHTWDVEVSSDPLAVIPVDVATAVVDNLRMIAGFAGKPTGGCRRPSPSTGPTSRCPPRPSSASSTAGSTPTTARPASRERSSTTCGRPSPASDRVGHSLRRTGRSGRAGRDAGPGGLGARPRVGVDHRL